MLFISVARLRHRGCRWLLFVSMIILPASLLAANPISQSLTLVEAHRRALQNNPELQVFKWRLQAQKGKRLAADNSPAYRVGLETENILGTGEFSGSDRGEVTLSLSSVIELGGKRRSRVRVATSRIALVEAEREARALDLLGEVTQHFIGTLALQEKIHVAEAATNLAETSHRLVSERVRQGATPMAEALRANAALRQARLRENALKAEFESRRYKLATLWGAEGPEFDRVNGTLFAFDDAIEFAVLDKRLTNSPALDVFASEVRLREAEVVMARSQSTSAVNWHIGVKHSQDVGDSAFTAGVSVPLFSGRRNRGDVQTALASREVTQQRKAAALLDFRARLFKAWKAYQHNVTATKTIRTDVIPMLEKALAETRRAYERGRYRYVDWATAQRELFDAQLAKIDAASNALLNQALIEQLTAQPLAEQNAMPQSTR